MAEEESSTNSKAVSTEAQSSDPVAAVTPDPPPPKVKVHFLPVGSAPLMKKNKFQLDRDQKFASVQLFLRKMLKLKEGDSLWLYCNSAFCPSQDEFVGDLNDCFAVRGELQIQYSLQEAWG
jgi:ubiquitin-like protein ATG12